MLILPTIYKDFDIQLRFRWSELRCHTWWLGCTAQISFTSRKSKPSYCEIKLRSVLKEDAKFGRFSCWLTSFWRKRRQKKSFPPLVIVIVLSSLWGVFCIKKKSADLFSKWSVSAAVSGRFMQGAVQNEKPISSGVYPFLTCCQYFCFFGGFSFVLFFHFHYLVLVISKKKYHS